MRYAFLNIAGSIQIQDFSRIICLIHAMALHYKCLMKFKIVKALYEPQVKLYNTCRHGIECYASLTRLIDLSVAVSLQTITQ